MGNIFSLDSKLMQVLGRFADLMILNIWTLVCCIPIITIGASLTAMHNVLLKIYRDEQTYITRQFFKAFKENLKQSTLIFLIYLVLLIFLGIDYTLIRSDVMDMPKFIQYILIVVTILMLFSYTWIYILQSRYENKIRTTIRNSFVVSISKVFYTIMMILFDLIPLLAIYYFEALVPAIILLGFTVPGILKTMLYSRVFDQLEGIDRKALKAAQMEDDGWTVELEEEEQPVLEDGEAVAAISEEHVGSDEVAEGLEKHTGSGESAVAEDSEISSEDSEKENA